MRHIPAQVDLHRLALAGSLFPSMQARSASEATAGPAGDATDIVERASMTYDDNLFKARHPVSKRRQDGCEIFRGGSCHPGGER